MRASYKWLKELCPLEATPEQVAERFTAIGLEVEGQKVYGDLPNVVIAEVRGKRPHPSRDKLTLVRVFDGAGEQEVVCGAPNVPEPGARVLLAKNGAKLPNGMVIAERKVAGVVSNGMLCGESELDIGPEADGIVVLPTDFPAKLGTPVSEALDLADVVFEIGLTPNRPDCLGHVGLARELSAVFGLPLRHPEAKAPAKLRQPVAERDAGVRSVALFVGARPGASPAPRFGLQVDDAARCPRYAAATIDGVQVGLSPFWLRYRLHVLGLRPINNVVDATNLVLVEYGYPTHAFDRALLKGSRIHVRTARAGEQMQTLDGVTRALGADDLLICDAARPVAVAGVMGGEESGVTEATRDLLIECAYFDPRSVRRTSRRLGLHTDASHRFERGVDPRAVPAVLARVVSLIGQIAGGEAAIEGQEICSDAFARRAILLRPSRQTALLGTVIPVESSEQILTALGCEVEQRPEGLSVRAPTWRPDLGREEDLIEEVARIWGYDRIPTEVPHVRSTADGTPPITSFLRRAKERAAAIGLTEAVNLAFTSPKQLEHARAPSPYVTLANPLSEERGVMRSSLLPGLAHNLLRAQRHQVAQVTLFELARVFHPSGGALPTERQLLAIVLWGARASWLGDADAFDFYDGKGVLEALLPPLVGCPIATVTDDALAREAPFLHPRRSARVQIGEASVGVLGELHPDVLDVYELTGPVVYAEIEVAALFSAGRVGLPPQVQSLPRFPASGRDLAIVVDEGIEAGDVASALRSVGGVLVERVALFDQYRGGQLPAGKKSLAFHITYRDAEATLTDPRVDDAHASLVAEARRRFAAEVRG